MTSSSTADQNNFFVLKIQQDVVIDHAKADFLATLVLATAWFN